jgi:hypothetical protein
MRKTKLAVTALISIAVVGVIAFLLISPAPLKRDAPRNLPWVLPDYRNAHTQWEVGVDGRIYAEVEHFFLEGISPAMVAWFYQQLPISTVELNGTVYPLYHIFHPVGHGRIRVVEGAPDGSPGMAQGATIMREEWFGPYDSRGTARMVEFSNDGMLAIPIAAGLEIGHVRHIYHAENGGTAYKVQAVIGSDLPVIGPMLNWFIRTRVFHPAMMALWQQHQIEEVASLQFFLADLYAQRGDQTHYLLKIPE